jgi:hypothetical protein
VDVVEVAIERHESGAVVLADGVRSRSVERLRIARLLDAQDDVVAPIEAAEDLIELDDSRARRACWSAQGTDFVSAVS